MVDGAIERQEGRDGSVRARKIERVVDFGGEEGLRDFVEFFVEKENVEDALKLFEEMVGDEVS